VSRRLAVAHTLEDADPDHVRHRTVAVIDVLRATSTLTAAFAAGAAEAIPAPTPEAARRIRAGFPGDATLLCGERGRVRLPGFDLGNSPREFTPERVSGKRLVVATTNGSRALLRAAPSPEVLVAAFMNARAVVARLLEGTRDLLLCASGDGGRPCPEDTLLAGCLVERILEAERDAVPDGPAREALRSWEEAGGDVATALSRTEAGRELIRLGLEPDLTFCAALDTVASVPACRPGTATVVPGPGQPRSQASR